jgi:hippurate hydrolase
MIQSQPTLERNERHLPDVLDRAEHHFADVVSLRRRLHQVPEVDLDLPKTQRLLLDALEGLDLEITTGRGLSSIVAVLRGGKGPGPVVLLRADMDALPVTEAEGLEYASQHEGRMHACGHDLHAAGLVGAAKILCDLRDELAGDVIFMFQPGEENPGGALPMIEEGLLEAAGRPIDAAYSVHVHSHGLPFGVFRSKPGVINAHNDEFSVRVIGAGGHASAPSRCQDPLPAACEMVLALQSQITRTFDVFDPLVLTIGRFIGGEKDNVIPDSVEFGGTIRTFSDASRAKIGEVVPQVVRGIAEAHGLKVETDYKQGYPACVNDVAEFEFARGVVTDLFGAENFRTSVNPSGSGDDFAYIMQRVPGAYFGVGACAGDPETAAPGHSPRAVFDDSILRHTSAFLAGLALRRCQVN